ncbi:MAG TPA: methyltransferase domain-containing protein [Methanoregula sp.]|nr:methyltransferase domain-containing protein [Methanoregula sp.]
MVSPDVSPTFTWNAADYNKSSPAQRLWAQELIAKSGLFGNERVIDIGCGDGKVTAAIAASVPQGAVTGIDSSPEMIRFAREHFPRRIHPNLTFIQMDARHLTFLEEFDVVFSNAALHWISDHRPVLAGIARSLVPGGRAVLQMGGKGNADQVFSVLKVLLGNRRWKRYFDGFSFVYGFFGTAEYRQWLADVGLEPIRVELIPKDMVYSDREDFAGWIRTTWLPWMTRLPEGEKLVFIEAFIDEYLAMYPADAEGAIHIGMMRLEAEEEKGA